MGRFVSIPLLAIGTVLGYGLAFHGMHHHHRYGRDAWESHIADVCVGAARDAKRKAVKADKAPSETPSSEAESNEP